MTHHPVCADEASGVNCLRPVGLTATENGCLYRRGASQLRPQHRALTKTCRHWPKRDQPLLKTSSTWKILNSGSGLRRSGKILLCNSDRWAEFAFNDDTDYYYNWQLWTPYWILSIRQRYADRRHEVPEHYKAAHQEFLSSLNSDHRQGRKKQSITNRLRQFERDLDALETQLKKSSELNFKEENLKVTAPPMHFMLITDDAFILLTVYSLIPIWYPK